MFSISSSLSSKPFRLKVNLLRSSSFYRFNLLKESLLAIPLLTTSDNSCINLLISSLWVFCTIFSSCCRCCSIDAVFADYSSNRLVNSLHPISSFWICSSFTSSSYLCGSSSSFKSLIRSMSWSNFGSTCAESLSNYIAFLSTRIFSSPIFP